MIVRTTIYNFINFLRLLASAFHLSLCVHSALTLHFHGLHLQSYRNYVKEISGSFKDPARVDLGILKKIVSFLGFQNELARDYKQGNLVSYFLNNTANTCLYGLKISENIEIGHFFQSGTFFHLSSNLHTSCVSAFNEIYYATSHSAMNIMTADGAKRANKMPD